MFAIKEFELAGRIGVIKVKGKSVETPAFFPVIDVSRQELSAGEIKEIGYEQIITSAYLTYKRLGEKLIKDGIHNTLGFDGMVMTDSGAYQILRYGRIDVGQDTIINLEKAIGSDIAVILDKPTGDVNREEAEASVEETLRNAREALRLIDDKTLWVLPIQGGKYLDLVKRSSEESSKLGFGMFAIGSPTIFLERYNYKTIIDIVATAKKYLPPEKPVHLFGAGHPLIIPFAVSLGVDTFDSASYVLYARDNRYMTEYGIERLENMEYFPCNCPVCSKHTPKELREMNKRERVKLLSMHNLYIIKKSINRTKQAIKEGRLWELLVEISRQRPEAYEALRTLTKYIGLLSKYNPRYKGKPRGLRFFSIENSWNPRIIEYKKWVLTRYEPESLLILLKPLPKSRYCAEEKGIDIIYYAPYLGLIPRELCGLYPTVQFHYYEPAQEQVKMEMINAIRAFVSRMKGLNRNVEIVIPKNTYYAKDLVKEAERLKIKITYRC
ncbi:MAG: tRNA guanosine(15) transglycosylase TgtA [Caldisphaeraceae archaeon]|nr:tRNA guanosine(15) transglycosylase TgtA [Caldisphaeraceae archaeon]